MAGLATLASEGAPGLLPRVGLLGCCVVFFLKILFIYLFLEMGGGGRKRERNISMLGCLLCTPGQGPGHNPSMCPDQESNRQPFALWDSTQPLSHASQGMDGVLNCFSLGNPYQRLAGPHLGAMSRSFCSSERADCLAEAFSLLSSVQCVSVFIACYSVPLLCPLVGAFWGE